MKIPTASQIREADSYTIKHEPVRSIDLMERAASRLFEWISGHYSAENTFMIFAGPGNNGGDGWALARLLWKADYHSLEFFLLKITDKLSPDSEENRRRLQEETGIRVVEVVSRKQFPEIATGAVVVDALFGSGLSRPLEGLAGELVEYLNAQQGKSMIAIDIPSGLFSENDDNSGKGTIIHADHTLTFQFPKLAFFYHENVTFTGNWEVLPIGLHPGYVAKVSTPYHYLLTEDVWPRLHSRNKFSHKGTYGHALLIAGSYGMMGAAVLAARAVIRSGVGLLTSHVPRLGVDIIQTAVPESLLSVDESDILFTEHPDTGKFTAFAIGPGINRKSNSKKGLLALLDSITKPVVIDADALNLLSGIENWMELIPANSVLTPHPKEFERLFGTFPVSYERMEAQIGFSKKLKSVIVLKGANTCITTPEGQVYFNSTGNPGMAKGGSGDVLTGIILGLLAQGYSCEDAAVIGVFVHGLAGDLAADKNGQTGMIPSDITDNIGRAFYVLELEKKKSIK